MRSFLIAFAGLMAFAGAAQANVSINVDKNNQLMTVAVDGVTKYQWPVSTGIPSRETPNGTFRAFRMEADHFSKEFDDAPMPHSIFFTKIGHAIHGTESESRLGTPASHGCVRLSRANATTLYALVEKEGVLNTTVTLTGSASIALARNPRNRPHRGRAPRSGRNTYAAAIRRRRRSRGADAAAAAAGRAADAAPMTATSIRPTSSDTARYPAPRGSRPLYDAQGYQQPQYYGNRGYVDQYGQPVYAPRPYYRHVHRTRPASFDLSRRHLPRHLAVHLRPLAHGIEQRPVALLDDMALRERRARLEAERAHHPVVAVVAKQHHANQGRQRRAAGFAKAGCDLGAALRVRDRQSRRRKTSRAGPARERCRRGRARGCAGYRQKSVRRRRPAPRRPRSAESYAGQRAQVADLFGG